MSSWRKHFKPVNTVLPVPGKSGGQSHSSNRFSSWLPEVYQGPPDRLQRYVHYEQMDMDHEVSAALDCLAEFCTQPNLKNGTPFEFSFYEQPSPAESEILTKMLKRWCQHNELNRRMFRMFRSTLLYGDQFFIRDPETYKLFWVDPHKIEKIVVNESEGKQIETYFIKDMDLNLQTLVASSTQSQNKSAFLGAQANVGLSKATSSYANQFGTSQDGQSLEVNAKHVVHLSMSEGLDNAWPFGVSILEPVFKVFKQKTLLEDAMLIYRIHRAPERRIFKIDVGTLPPDKARQYLERVRYEIQQKRIPNKTGGGADVTDAAYNPLSTLEDYFFAVSADGRGSSVDVLPGGTALGEINDMLYFNNKMFRALGIPSSYMPTGPEDGSAASSNGQVGSAFIQEFRFTEKCKRHQRQLVQNLDHEFKMFLKAKGITIDSSVFELKFSEPQNFSEYKKIELEAARINIFTALADVGYIAKQVMLKRYLGWTDDEILENERYWKMENAAGSATDTMPSQAGLSQVGMSSSSFAPDQDLGSEDASEDSMSDDDMSADDMSADDSVSDDTQASFEDDLGL